MAIPYRDIAEEETPGAAGYLKFVQREDGQAWLGALFLIDARGEPIEFTHARVRAPSSFLWRQDDLRSHCLGSLCAAMFDTCPVLPALIVCLADEVEPHLFSEYIRVDLPLARMSDGDTPLSVSSAETLEETPAGDAADDTVSVCWTDAPAAGSPARVLFDALASRGMLVEPFSRAEAGLREVYQDLFV